MKIRRKDILHNHLYSHLSWKGAGGGLWAVLFLLLTACGGKSSKAPQPQEDRSAKQMLQGIWVDEDEQTVAFRAKGDTIFYPDTTSQPVYFQIFNDTLVLHGARDVKYAILKQTPHLFIFRNQTGDEVKLTLSDDPDDLMAFTGRRPQALNQNKLIKRDTVVTYQSERYHLYTQVNPTTYKVVKASYNDEGVEVDNVYHDNIVNLHIYHGSAKVFSRDFHKQQFAKEVPADVLSQLILNDIVFKSIDNKGIHFIASLGIPDSMSTYQVEIVISFNGKLSMDV